MLPLGMPCGCSSSPDLARTIELLVGGVVQCLAHASSTGIEVVDGVGHRLHITADMIQKTGHVISGVVVLHATEAG